MKPEWLQLTLSQQFELAKHKKTIKEMNDINQLRELALEAIEGFSRQQALAKNLAKELFKRDLGI